MWGSWLYSASRHRERLQGINTEEIISARSLAGYAAPVLLRLRTPYR
jgi:hypothetical protein